MKTDACSAHALLKLKENGKIGEAQAMYLSVFIDASAGMLEFDLDRTHHDMTHDEATEAVFKKFGKRFQPRNGRIAELTDKGLLIKAGKTRSTVSGLPINTWKWTGRYEPIETERILEACGKCGSPRQHWVTKPVNKDQMRFPYVTPAGFGR